MSGMAPPILREYGTDQLRTVVRAAENGDHRWERTLGPAAPYPFTPEGWAGTVPTADPGETVTLVPGTGDEHHRTYRVPGATPLMAVLIAEGPRPEFRALLRGAGGALRQLHDGPARPAPGTRPRGLTRLELWLSGRAPRLWASQAAGHVRDRIGSPRWRTLRRWSRELVAGPGDGAPGDDELVAAHGAPGLGALVPDPDGGSARLLVGEDRCVLPRRADLGWIVGELVELSLTFPEHADGWQQLLAELVAGYGTSVTPPLMRVAALRIGLHAHDFSAYVGWDPVELDRWSAMLAMLVDRDAGDGGDPAAPGTGEDDR